MALRAPARLRKHHSEESRACSVRQDVDLLFEGLMGAMARSIEKSARIASRVTNSASSTFKQEKCNGK
jgi:hypothetical protein